MLFIFSVCLHYSLWNSFRNTVGTASLNSRKRAASPVPKMPWRPAWCRHRKSKGCFYFFLTILENSCVKVVVFFS